MKLNELLEQAQDAFAFLLDRGFKLNSRKPAASEAFKDGWHLEYQSPSMGVRVQYYDDQFDVIFRRDAKEALYLIIDQELYARRSGFSGDMFPREKLGPAIARIADDIAKNYSNVLSGDPILWRRIEDILAAPSAKKRLP